jgi:hypothetical protein
MRNRLTVPSLLAVLVLLAGHSAPFAHDTGVGLLLLGDGKISREPKAGNVFSCQTSFGGRGAQTLGPWAQNGVWKPDNKPAVKGAVEWPNASINIAVEGTQRVVRSNGLPNHKTGIFPIERSDPAYKYDRNPNAIMEQNVLLRLPAQPVASGKPSCVPMGMIGFSLTGVAIFNALDAMGRDAPAYEIQDACSGHPEMGGTYHYHDYSPCMADASGKAGKHSDLVGYALDGFGIYGPKADGGRRLKNADLDACHGHAHEIVWDGQRKVMYHYHFTDEYPYSLGCFNGTPVATPRPAPAALRPGLNGGPPGAPPQQGGNPRDRGALEAAAKELGVDASRLGQALGPPPPDFARAARELGVPEQKIRDAMQRARAGR